MSESPEPACLAVLNPGGRDAPVDYAAGPGRPGDGGHPPVNYHAYAAATRGAFFDRADRVIASRDRFHAVLVLIRSRMSASLAAARKLKAAGLPVIVAWKEAGPGQIAAQLSSPGRLGAYAELLGLADGLLSPTAILPPRWGQLDADGPVPRTRFIPTPYPLEDPAWDFSVPAEERAGILVGTRQFFQPSRCHVEGLARAARLAEEAGAGLTVINGDKRRGLRMLGALAESFPGARWQVVERPLAYPRYLALMAAHRLVYQRDRSQVPGQVAGDAALCRVLCAGGDSALETLVFPDLAATAPGGPEAAERRAGELLRDEGAYLAALEAARAAARERASYTAVAAALARWLRDLGCLA